MDPKPFVRVIYGADRVKPLLREMKKGETGFFLCLGSTATSDEEGISAAGATPQLRRLTPATDAEAILLGQTKSFDKLPVSPVGIVSPVVITRACLKQSAISPIVVDCGTFVQPQVPFYQAGGNPAASVRSGQAMPLKMVQHLFERGYEFGVQQASHHRNVVIAECVPGGTTTALAVLTALGYDARNSLSSSIPDCNHDRRWQLVEEGLRCAGLKSGEQDVLKIIAAVGDPMQPFVVGMALAACQSTSTILGGGSQMLAVYAMCKALGASHGVDVDQAKLAVVTTKWVAFDPCAQLEKLSVEIGAPFAAACPDFLASRHKGLRAYEDGNVKEGVGAGAAMAIAYEFVNQESAPARMPALPGRDKLMFAIDECYDELVGAVSVS